MHTPVRTRPGVVLLGFLFATVAQTLLLPPVAGATGTSANVVAYGADEDQSAGSVSVRLGVWDEGGTVVRQLEPQDFQVLDGGKPSVVESVALGPHDPLSAVVVVDNSRHWVQANDPTVDARGVLVNATSAFLDRLELGAGGRPRVAVLTMNQPADLSAGSADQLTSDISVARARTTDLTMVAGDAPLRDRLTDAISLLRAEPAGRRRVLLLVSDGNDVASPVTYDQILAAADQADVQVFAAGVAAQQAAQLTVLAQQRHGVFRNVRRAADLPATMAGLADDIQLSYLVTYRPALREGPHSGQIALRGQPWVRFGYDSGVRPPEPRLVLDAGQREIGWMWSAVHVSVEPGAQRPVNNVVYRVDGRPVATGKPGESTTLRLPFGFPTLSGHWLVSAQVDDGLPGETDTLEYADSLDREAIISSGAIVALIVALVLVRRRSRKRTPLQRQSSTDFALRPTSTETIRAHAGPIALPTRGILGRGADAYGIDGANPFFGGVSRQHVEFDVRDGQVFARACTSPTVGPCHVEVQAPGVMTTSVLSKERFTQVEVGTVLTLGARPAPAFSERPTFALDGPPPVPVAEDRDPAGTRFVLDEPFADASPNVPAAFSRWLAR